MKLFIKVKGILKFKGDDTKMEFECIWKKGKKVERWLATVECIHDNGQFCEVFVVSRSTIRLIIGYGEWGNFVCVPDWNVGTRLSDFKDLFWNSEKLTNLMGNVDGITAATVIKGISDIVEHNFDF
jgi:hypothetical protein